MFAVCQRQPLSSNNLDLSAPEEAYSRNVRASGTRKFGYEGVFKIYPVSQFSSLSSMVFTNTLLLHTVVFTLTVAKETSFYVVFI